MNIGPLKINLSHLFAFVLGMAGILGSFISKAIAGGQPVTISLIVAGTGGLIWALFQTTILPDIEGGGGGGGSSASGNKSSGSLGGPKPPASLRTRAYSLASLRFELIADRISKTVAATASGFAVFFIVQAAVVGCKNGVPQLPPQLTQVEQIILQDLQKGYGAVQIEEDVANALAGQPGVDLVAIVNEAISLLIDVGVIPPGILPTAVSIRAEETSKLAARKAPH